MKHPNLSLLTGLISVSLLCLSTASAQTAPTATINWGGNTGGDWSLGTNWSGGNAPGATERGLLVSVTDGSTRIVTQDNASGITVNSLRFVQDVNTGVNRLDLSGNMTLTGGSGTDYTVSLTNGATHSQVVTNLNGYSILLTGGAPGGGYGTNFGGTINFNSAGSSLLRTGVGGHVHPVVSGIINVSADGKMGYSWLNNASTGNFSTTFQSGSQLNISNSSSFSLVFENRRTQDPRNYTLNNSGTIDIEAGSTLDLSVNATHGSSSGRMNVTYNNLTAGSILHGGTLALKPHKHIDAVSVFSRINQSGTWTVSGDGAVIRRLTTAQDSAFIAVPEFNLLGGGILKGSGLSDTMEFNEQVALGNRMTIQVADLSGGGIIRAGDGSQGTGLDSVGTLNLRDINVTFQGDNATLELDLGGIAGGEFDRFRLLTGLTDPAGAGTLDLTAGGTLQLWAVNGFDPELMPNFSINLIQAGSVSGQFGTVRLGATDFTGNSLLLGDGRTLSVNYTAGAVDLVLIPEPSTLALMGISALAVALASRRRRAA